MKVHFNNITGANRRKAALVSSFLAACLLSFTVYGAVSYDSSKDPIVAYSAMEKYVTEQLADIRASVESMSSDIEILWLTGGGGGSGGDGGVSFSGMQTLLNKITQLENSIAALQNGNAELQAELANTKNEFQSLIDELVEQDSLLENQISELKDSISTLNSQLKSTKSSVSTLEKNFKQVSDISTKLEKVSYIVDSITGKDGDIPTLKTEVEGLKAAYNDLLEEMGHAYKVVEVPVGAKIYAKDADDTLLLILRSGAATVISPYNTPGQTQGINDLTDGIDLYNGDVLPTYHSVLIPRGGSDGRGIEVVGVDSAYFMIGGEYTIVTEE